MRTAPCAALRIAACVRDGRQRRGGDPALVEHATHGRSRAEPWPLSDTLCVRRDGAWRGPTSRRPRSLARCAFSRASSSRIHDEQRSALDQEPSRTGRDVDVAKFTLIRANAASRASPSGASASRLLPRPSWWRSRGPESTPRRGSWPGPPGAHRRAKSRRPRTPPRGLVRSFPGRCRARTAGGRGSPTGAKSRIPGAGIRFHDERC
jgi:hypothetical protein